MSPSSSVDGPSDASSASNADGVVDVDGVTEVAHVRDRRRVLAVTATTLFCSALIWFNYAAVLPQVTEEWGLTGIEAGAVFGAFQAGYLLSILPAGWLADRYSPRWVIAVGAAGTALPSLAFAALADGIILGVALRFLSGLFVAGVYVPGMRFLSDWFPKTVRGQALGAYIGTFELGSGLSFVFATAVAEAVDWRVAIAATSVGGLVISPLIVVATRDAPNRVEPTASGIGWSLFRNRPYLLAVGIYAWHNWELFGVRGWLLAFLVATPAFAATGSTVIPGLVVGAMIVASGVGNLAGGWLSDRIDRQAVLAIGLGASAFVSAVFGFIGGLTTPLLVGVVLVYGVVLALDSAPTSTLVTEVVSDEHVGTALSVQSLVGFSTTIISPVVFGIALDWGGYTAAFPMLAAGALVGLGFVGLLGRTVRS
ncbi:MFS transporter [Halohasta litorea]|uniref:MFS transporter n=1 Tax=Halohasta litorea TaxID=869891 RepID=A0ABD6DEY4_9EURY|nr:MFS transporter [Halohasta litorea]